MPTETATFSEAWYRVADLRPRLRATLRVHRQHFRGRVWHIVQDPAAGDFLRLHPAAYRFVGMLDGRRTVAEVWRACGRIMGDEALTQGEAIEVLGQLYAANLLWADLPADVEGLFQRYRRRRVRQWQATLSNFLFLRIPLWDPDSFLNGLVGLVGPAFSLAGLVLWMMLVAAGAWFAWGNWNELTAEAAAILAPDRLIGSVPILYAVLVCSRLVHELAHAFACKRLGRLMHSGGEVHAMGIMLVVLAPLPYVDASSAWALRSKLHRTVVGAAGVMAELALAAAAAIVWAWTGQGTASWGAHAHAAALCLMVVAGLPTLLFNANPLLRLDGYYVLADLLEIPNLSDRSRQYVAYLVKRYVWGASAAANPAGSRGEAGWFIAYAAASWAFRLVLCVQIILMLSQRFFILGAALAAGAVGVWVVVPLARFIRYLSANPELARVRQRAILTTAAGVAGILAFVGLIPAPDAWPVEGTIAPSRQTIIHMKAAGHVEEALAAGSAVQAADRDPNEGGTLLRAANPDLELEYRKILHEREILAARERLARTQSRADRRYAALVQVLEKDIQDLDEQAGLLRRELADLSLRSPLSGTWLPDEPDLLVGAYLQQGQRVGLVADLDEMVVRIQVPPRVAGMLIGEAAREVEIRLTARPGQALRGTVTRSFPSGHPPPEATDASQPPGAPRRPAEAGGDVSAAEQAIEVQVALHRPHPAVLPGQRAIVRFQLPSRSLLAQWWRSVRQLAQRRLGL